ncbi:MAG: hypothetical protein KME32_07905 [Mojavia pulchra JT2-VF2]|uniref:Uncharacterized protein n=1 Tax=Mojavia pulchra JT2-VF2 TaxID=287848 RepID=A0A951PXL5_9NOST|nr:hypothetical protein [Mojavia pulchra JT2-VF2]
MWIASIYESAIARIASAGSFLESVPCPEGIWQPHSLRLEARARYAIA